LSEQGNYSKSKGVINISADASDPNGTILHELGHAKFLNLSKAEQAKLLEQAKNTTDPAMQGYKSVGAYEEIVADTMYKTKPSTPRIKPEEPIKTIPEEPLSVRKTSGVALGIEAKAIEDKVTEGYSNLPGYEASTFKAQSDFMDNLVKTDISKVKNILDGTEAMPAGGKSAALIASVEKYIKENPEDQEIRYKLANSKVTSELSQAGSDLAFARLRDADSAAAMIEEVKRAREANVRKVAKQPVKKGAKPAPLPSTEITQDEANKIFDASAKLQQL
jgi:hypothetical protein